jgi:hypothetical protein
MARTLERRRTGLLPQHPPREPATAPAPRTTTELRDDAIVAVLLWLTAGVQLIAGIAGGSSYIRSCGIGLAVLAAAWTIRYVIVLRRR